MIIGERGRGGDRTRAARKGGVILLLGAFCLSCGGTKGKAEDASSSEASDSSESRKEAPPALEPASAPPGTVVRFRARDLSHLTESVFKAASIPVDWQALVADDPEGQRLLRVIDLNGTIEGAVVLNPRLPARPMAFYSIGVRGIDPVLQFLDEGSIDVQEGPSGVHLFQYDGAPCGVGHAISGSPARVVCADTAENLGQLIAYALRGLPSERLSDAAVYMGFDMAPVRERHGAEFKTYLRWMPAFARALHVGNPTFDRAISDGAVLVADEAGALIDELESITGEVIEKDGDFRVVVRARFVGQGSETVKILRELSAGQKVAPALFDQVPSTASAAGYSLEISAERAKSWWSVLSDLAQGSAEVEGTSPAFSKKVGDVVERLGPRGTMQVIAHGPAVTSRVDDKSRIHTAWAISGTTRPLNEVTSLVDDLSWVLSSPELVKVLPEGTEAPMLKKSKVSIPGVGGARVYEWKLSGASRSVARVLGASIPEGFTVEQGVDDVLETQEGLFAIARIGEGTWAMWGRNADEIGEAFRALSSKDTQRLGDLGALDGVRSEPAVAAGFALLGGLAGATAWGAEIGATDTWDDLRKAAPHRGAVPMTYFLKVPAGEQTEAVIEMRFPTEFVQDAVMIGYMLGVEAETPPAGTK